MNKDELKKMLNTVYEMEGLIDMAIRRGEDVPEGVIQLIVEKSETLSQITSTWNYNPSEEMSMNCEDYSVDDDQSIEEPTEGVDSISIGRNDSEPDDNIDVEFVYDEETEDVIESDEQPESQPAADASLFDASAFDDDADESEENVEDDNDYEHDETYDFDDDEHDNEYIDQDDMRSDYDACRQNEEPTDYNAPNRKDIRKYFTINDRYRFRRELFSNNEVDFVDNLNLVQAMSCYEDAEDYFYNDLQWDSESEDVVEFMSIIFRYFNS